MDINVTIKCPDLPLAAAVFAKAILREEYPENNPTVSSQDTVPTAPAPAPALVNPTPSSPVMTTPSPAQIVPTAPAAIPTTPAPPITGEAVAKAGADLIASNPAALAPLNALLQKYGVSCAQELKPEQIGPFATEMRALGAMV